MKRSIFVLICVFAGMMTVAHVAFSAKPQASSQSGNYSVRMLPLPDNNAGDIAMDYIAYDAATNTVWVPAGNTGAVDVIDVETSKIRQVTGFPTKEQEGRNGKRVVGPSGISIGDGVVYIGSRGDATVC